MSDASTLSTEYVPQKVFDIYLENVRKDLDYEKRLIDERLDKFQAILERNFAEMRANLIEIRGEIRVLDQRMNGMDKRIDGLEKRIDDLHQSHNKWFAVFGILFSIATIVAPVAVAVVQYYLTR
ncbi:MAG: hypothetical protein IJS40_06215 [Synergistaceae bacterium]|nr:hypothetical protein [Synergistaceae bacterium]